jgi:hypothetical protein
MQTHGAQPRPWRFVRDRGAARDDQHIGIGGFDRLRRKRGIRRVQVARDVANVRDGEEVVDVRAAPGGVERREAHADERQGARSLQGVRRPAGRVEPAANPGEQPRRFASVTGCAAQRRNRREVVGEGIDFERLRGHARARKVAQTGRLIGDAHDEIGIESSDGFAVDRAHRADARNVQRRGRTVREVVDADDLRPRADREEIFGQRGRQRHHPHRDRRRDRERGCGDHRVDNSTSNVRPGAG